MMIMFLALWFVSLDIFISLMNFIFLIGVLSFLKFNNNFMALLLSLELLGVSTLIYWVFMVINFSIPAMSIFFLMVTMVAEATLSLSILITLARVKSNELEMANLVI